VIVVNVSEQTETSAARRAAVNLASDLRFNETETGKVAVVVTEMATNLLKHAGSGQILICGQNEGTAPSLEVLAIDTGPGMTDPAACARDGYSTAGSSGTGLGAIARMSASSEVYSIPGQGTIVRAVCRPSAGTPEGQLDVAGLSVPHPGELDCGDAFAVRQSGTQTLLLLADGLGHGLGAAEAARQAVTTFLRTAETQLTGIMQALHNGLRGTRGAAVAVVSINPEQSKLRFCGTGNVSCTLVDGGEVRHCVSMHGIAGHQIRTPREFEYDWNARTMVVMTSDGISSHWDLRTMPGIWRQSAMMTAAAIWRAARRKNDDSTALVVKSLGVMP
jgi:anti-sigma regulatory factor (Ser/Thr protein kinase)